MRDEGSKDRWPGRSVRVRASVVSRQGRCVHAAQWPRFIIHHSSFIIRLIPHPSSFILLLLSASAAVPAAAQQLDVLKKMPAELLRYTGGARPDADGMVGYNQGGFKSPEFQCGAMHYLLRARGPRGPAGHRRRLAGDRRHVPPADRERQLRPPRRNRTAAPRPWPSGWPIWIRRSSCSAKAAWGRNIGSGSAGWRRRSAGGPLAGQAPLPGAAETRGRRRPEPPAVRRLGLRAVGRFGGRRRVEATGRTFVDLAMAQFRPGDGVFLEKGGHDSSYQAVAGVESPGVAALLPRQEAGGGGGAAVRWELGRVRPDGQIDTAGNTRTGLGRNSGWATARG